MRLTLVATFALAISSQAHANIEQQLADCASQTDKLDRLMCYDALAASVKSAVPTQLPATETTVAVASASAVAAPAVAVPVTAKTSAPTAVVATSPQIQSSVEQEFGLQKKSVEEDDIKLYAEVVSIKKDPYGALIVKLSNNQTWKQVGTDRYKIKVDQTIYIEKGALSSYLLGSDDRNSTIRVKRLN